MADTLPEPKSRKEQYLAKAAGMDTEIPAEPMSREEQYLNAIAEGGGGGGGTSNFNDLTNRPQLNGAAMTGNTNITNFTGTDGTSAGAQGLVPAPTVADTDKFLKSDGTWDTAGGGSSVNVVQTVGTSTTDVMSQNAVTQMVFTSANQTGVRIGAYSGNYGSNSVAVGSSATTNAYDYATAIGYYAKAGQRGAVAIGANSQATMQGEVNIGSNSSNTGYKNTFTRLLRGLHDGVASTDAVTLNQISQLITAINSACGTSIVLASDGSITNANSGNNGGNAEDPSDPGDPGDPGDIPAEG